MSNAKPITIELITKYFIKDIAEIIHTYYYQEGKIGECNALSYLPPFYNLVHFSKERSNGHRRFISTIVNRPYFISSDDIRINDYNSIYVNYNKTYEQAIISKRSYLINNKFYDLTTYSDDVSENVNIDNKFDLECKHNIAIKHGNIDVIEWLYNTGQYISNCCMYKASKNNQIEILKWFHKRNLGVWSTKVMDYAAAKGHIGIVKWLHKNRTEGCTVNAMDWAAAKGKLEMVKWLHENRTEGCTVNAMSMAAINCHIDTVKWLHENRKEGCTVNAMKMSITNNNSDVVNYLKSIIS